MDPFCMILRMEIDNYNKVKRMYKCYILCIWFHLQCLTICSVQLRQMKLLLIKNTVNINYQNKYYT